ncbi:MAG: SDR family NAD(P)-dependent oxidoreductase [Proteobacteria bacterium]|uniref:SDR family NAD(P)-dependent oxidoreductase n=1 Tax=Candidatus Avisuccinivibrio stercorigallinarum TaxID=2840704 RepID=A0A9D9DD35_9GAMM|nr:SDR family NAD(P)-dependent oxidoreductase [Candidatus Avisuccinivibrio stercorigallinarum]
MTVTAAVTADKGTVLVVGANAALAYPCLKFLLHEGYSLHLTCRTLSKALAVKARLLTGLQRAGNAAHKAASAVLEERIFVSALTLPASLEQVKALFASLQQRRLCGILIAAGMYAQTDALLSEGEPGIMHELQLLAVNFNALIPVIALGARELSAVKTERGRRPFIAVISSVAGVRGRASNYAYGASKAALSTYLSGLRQSRPELCVIDLRPGLIHSPMLQGRELPRILISKPECMVKALKKGLKHPRGGVFYVPGWWRLIMGVAALLPERLYQRLKL